MLSLLNLQTPGEAARVVLHEARRLHRAATAESLSTALPVLRRLIANKVLQGMSLPELYRSRAIVQRKHLLRMLAVEAGFASWETYRPVLDAISPVQLEHFDVAKTQAGHLNLWFAAYDEAQTYARQYGGRVMRVGGQAVVFPADSLAAQH
jgi:hypothetical protein